MNINDIVSSDSKLQLLFSSGHCLGFACIFLVPDSANAPLGALFGSCPSESLLLF